MTVEAGAPRVADDTARPDLVVNEIFGPTIQGEGPHTGRRCGFLRLGGCNLSCRWCDTPYTWDWTGVTDLGPFDPKVELHRRSQDDVIEAILEIGADLIVVSGGEPLNQATRLEPLVAALVERGVTVDVETNGTKVPTAGLENDVDLFVVSPKLAHSGDPEHLRIVPDSLRHLAALPHAHFKFVARTPDDIMEIDDYVRHYDMKNVWVMPEGQTRHELDSVGRPIAEAAIAHGWNFSSRLHVFLWNDQRGV